MRWMTCICVVAALFVAWISPCPAQSSARPRISILTVDTNVAFGFLPPPTGILTNTVSEAKVFQGKRLRKLRNEGDILRSEVIQTIGGKPGEREADAEQRPNAARDAAASAQRDEIIATTPLMPSEPPPDEKKPEKEIWINLKAKEETPQGSQMPFDTWVLKPGESHAAPSTPTENLREPTSPVVHPTAPFDYTPSPFSLGLANKPVAPEASSAKGILSANPIDLPLFGTRRETASPQLPKYSLPPPAPVTATKVPVVSPSSPFAPVEFNTPFGAHPAQGSPPFGGAVVPQPSSVGSPAAISRPPFANPFSTENARVPVKTRDEQAVEKWEKYFEERKRGF